MNKDDKKALTVLSYAIFAAAVALMVMEMGWLASLGVFLLTWANNIGIKLKS